MKALITGASSGIGYDISKYLSKLGYDLIVVARRQDKLEQLKSECSTNVQIICMDLGKEENSYCLYNKVKDENIDVLINNAGFGLFGEFKDTDVQKEIDMIDLNIKTVHILTKLFLKDMVTKNCGHILNVSSVAGFMPSGPLMSTYYATKAYVLSLSRAIYTELKLSKSKVKISVLCPGPVKTEFNDVAKVDFQINPLSSEYVAKYAVNKMLKGKLEIVPGFSIKIAAHFNRFLPTKLVSKIAYSMQKKKMK